MTLREFNRIKGGILPFIKNKTTASEGTNLPVINLESADRPVYAPLPGDLICLYGVEENNALQLLIKSKLPKGVTPKKIDRLAKENLTKKLNDAIKAENTAWGGIRLVSGSGMTSSACMLSWIWDYIMDLLGDEVVFAIPARDEIYFLPAADKPGLKKMERALQSVFTKSKKRISKKIYSFNGWEISVVKE